MENSLEFYIQLSYTPKNLEEIKAFSDKERQGHNLPETLTEETYWGIHFNKKEPSRLQKMNWKIDLKEKGKKEGREGGREEEICYKLSWKYNLKQYLLSSQPRNPLHKERRKWKKLLLLNEY